MIIKSDLRPIVGAPVGMLSSALRVLSEHGYDVGEILEKCGIRESDLNDTGNRVTTGQYYAFNRYVIENTKVQGIGLLFGTAEHFMDYGVIGYALINSENLKMALEILQKYRQLAGPNYEHHCEYHDAYTSFICEANDYPLPLEWCVEGNLGAFASFIHRCLGEQARVSSVHVTYPAPNHAHMYEELFGCPAYFNQKLNEVRFPNSLLHIPFPTANSVLRDFCLRECDRMIAGLQADSSLVDQVEALIRSSPRVIPQFTLVAESLNMSPRTLHRRLSSEGTTYRKIIEDLRKRMVREYLLETDLEQKEVAYLLGYAEPANFYHAFQRWFDCTPTEFIKSNKDK